MYPRLIPCLPRQVAKKRSDGEVTEQADETCTMDVASRKTGVLSATLHNLSDELNPGPNNSVEFSVTTAAGVASGMTNTAVVKVTGPGE